MKVNFGWNNGLIFGIAQDAFWCIENEEETPNFDKEPDSVIVVYLGLFNINFIFENDDEPPLKKQVA